MDAARQALGDRIRELRRRHFGPRGTRVFAERLGLDLAEYERIERGTLPGGDVLVRICEITGEDLQWLLTGVAARGTVVISGSRGRHQQVLARVMQLLEHEPAAARQLEAFVGLLESGAALPAPEPVFDPAELVPVLAWDELPDTLPDPDDSPDGLPLARPATALSNPRPNAAELVEPTDEGERETRPITIVAAADEAGRERLFVRSRELARCFPAMFGVRIDDDSMTPVLRAGDIALVVPGAPPKLARPAVCKLAGEASPRFRVWLGEDDEVVHLGRSADGTTEDVPRAGLLWSMEVLYRVRPAA